MAFQEGFQPNGGFIPPQSAGGNGGGGAGGGVMFVTAENDSSTLSTQITSHTAGEIFEAIQSGKQVVAHFHEDPGFGDPIVDMYCAFVSAGYPIDNGYNFICFYPGGDQMTFSAVLADSYPSTAPVGPEIG